MDTAETIAPIALLHLSDIHFRNADNPILDRAAAIIAALRSLVQPVSVLFVVVTGDVAFSGLPAEYKLADAFFRDLLEELNNYVPGIEMHILFAPGNHDCDLISPPDLRDWSLLHPRLSTLDANGAIVQNCVSVQESYFAFVGEFGQEHSTTSDRLAKRFEFIINGRYRAAFTVYNTAWLSQNPERPGQLYIPESAFISPETPGDLEISLLHHPYNWLEPDNMTAFRKHLQETADVILSGHQHHPADFRLEDSDGASNYIIEAMAMHDLRASENGFNVVFVDPVEAKWKLNAFAWETKRYVRVRTSNDWSPFLRNKVLEDSGFNHTPDFKEYLSDPGLPFTHSNKDRVFLQDIFVYPELHQRPLQRKVEEGKPSGARIRSDNLLQWVHDSKRVLIIGEDKAGRTALAKTLYRDLRRQFNIVPLMLAAEGMSAYRRDSLPDMLKTEYVKQYRKSSSPAFFELPGSRRALIIDDLHRCKLNQVARASLVLNLELFADTIVVFVDPTFDIDILVGKVRAPLFGAYRQYNIAEMGHQLRGKLISKWVALRADAWTEESQTFREVIEKEKVIESLLSRRMLPWYPIIVLGMLQFLEATKNPHANTGSYGELYQKLITDRLASIAKKPSDIGTWYTLLARVAFSMFTSDTRTVTPQVFRANYTEYYSIYKIHYDIDALLDSFIDAQLLERRDGNIAFKYRDFYHFFVARYFDENVNDPAEASLLCGRLNHMADRVYYEEYASILVFYLYLAKDPNLIHRLLNNANRIYADTEPCDFDSHTEFLNTLYIAPPGAISLPEGDAVTNRDAYRARMDELDRKAPARIDGEKLAYSDDLDDFVKINIALKSMYILGQVSSGPLRPIG